jgi:glycosyltransferase involved in cell wall biosynthesis
MLSIVIPTYNEEDYLPILLSSLQSQSFTDYEVIVADNDSTDDTKSIAVSFGADVVSGGMPGKGRNIGATNSNGELILFLDADVILDDKDFLKDIITEFRDKKLDIATCEILPLSDKNIDAVIHSAYNMFITATASFMPFAPGFCILVDKKCHNFVNGFDEEIKLGEDSDYVKRISKHKKFDVLKSHKIPVSIRRLERDGRANVITKYILCGIYMQLFGNVKTNIFNYNFGHKKTK